MENVPIRYIIPLFALAAIALVLAIVGWINRRHKVGTSYFIMLVTMTLWLSFYAAGLMVDIENIGLYTLFAKFEYVTMVALPFFWLIYSLRYSEIKGWSSPGMIIIILLLPLLLVVISITEQADNLLYNHHSFLGVIRKYEYDIERPVWTYIHIAYSLLYFIIGTWLVIRYINRNPKMDLRQSVLVSLGVLIPWVGNITFIFRVTPIQNFDLAPWAFVLSASLLAWGMFYKNFLSIVGIARQAILDRMADGLMVLDSNNWIVEMNPAAQSIFQVRLDKNINVPAEALLRPYPDLMNNLRFQNRKHQEITIQKGDQAHYFDLSVNPLFDNKGKAIGRMVILHDITSLKQTELKLQEAKVRAEQADNLKSAFLANMSHEIRTPMNAIIGFTNLLNDPEISEEDRNEFMQHIRNSGNSLLQLIDDIIDISKIDANQIDMVPSDLVLRRFMTELFSYFNEAKAEAGKEKIQLSLVIPKEYQNLVAVIDAARLRQIMRHLLDNAIKFTHQGYIEFGFSMNDSSQIRFWVKDTGIGIALEKQSLIFERFARVMTGTRQEYGGTGLGLSLSKSLIERMGGKIWVESILGKGSTFIFTIPYIAGKEVTEEPSRLEQLGKVLISDSYDNIAGLELKPREELLPPMPKPVEVAAESGLPEEMPTEPGLIFEKEDFVAESDPTLGQEPPKTILVILEDQMTYLFIEMILRPDHYHVVWARNIFDARSYLSGENPAELVIFDLSGTSERGIEMVNEIRKNLLRRKILAIVPFEGSSQTLRAREIGCNGAVPKPIKPALLLDSVRKLLAW